MDTDSLKIIASMVADEAIRQIPYKIDWTPIIWVAGVIGTIFTAIVGVIVYLIKRSGDLIIDIQIKHGEEIKQNQLDIVKYQSSLNHISEQTDKRLQMIEKKVFKL